VLIAADVFYREALDPLPEGVEADWFESLDEAVKAAAGAEVLALGADRGWPLTSVVAAAPRLRWIHTRAAGVDRGQFQPLSLFRDSGIVVTNGSGISSTPIAEFVAMAVLAIAKGLPGLLGSQERHAWEKPPPPAEVLGSKALLVGFGDVGRAVWDRLRAFGIEATAVRRRPASEPDIEVIGPGDWQSRLGEFDWVVVTAPLTDDTRHLFGPAEFDEMSDDSWLLNFSRGGLVDQSALAVALRSGSIGGAFIDVCEPEPLPPNDELWNLPNVIITPHCSWLSQQFPRRAGELFLSNLQRWCAAEPLQNVVDLDAGY
jgi:phosphoglycerate dehydrogenase-like enzyme